MGLFDWFNKKPAETISVWMTREAKYAAIQKLVVNALSSNLVILVAHFPDCLNYLLAAIGDVVPGDRRVFLTLAENLTTNTGPGPEYSGSIRIIVGEIHPLRSHDEVILDFANSLLGKSVVEFHISLEDAVMQRNSGEWVLKTLKSLGMKEDEAIESRMVNRQIRKAQDLIAGQAFGDAHAESAEEWFEVNGVDRN